MQLGFSAIKSIPSAYSIGHNGAPFGDAFARILRLILHDLVRRHIKGTAIALPLQRRDEAFTQRTDLIIRNIYHTISRDHFHDWIDAPDQVRTLVPTSTSAASTSASKARARRPLALHVSFEKFFERTTRFLPSRACGIKLQLLIAPTGHIVLEDTALLRRRS